MTSIQDHAPWQVVRSTKIYAAPPWIELSLQQVRLPDGTLVNDYHHIVMPEYTVVFAETAEGTVVVERQYKHGIGHVTLMLPAGLIEPGENPLAAAERELLEETGYHATDWRHLGSFVPNSNYGCGKAHLYHARNARRVAEPEAGDLEKIEILLCTRGALLSAIACGDVASMSVAAAIALASHPQFDGATAGRSAETPGGTNLSRP